MTDILSSDTINERLVALRSGQLDTNAEQQAKATSTFMFVKPLADAATSITDALSGDDDRIKLGLAPIDVLTRGFGPKHLVFLGGYSHQGKCVTLDTLFHMADGTLRRAGDLAVGNGILGQNGPARITAIEPNGVHTIVKVATNAGRELRVTENHPVLTTGGWVKAADLTTEHHLVCEDGWAGFTEAMDPKDAFFLGLWQGDGHWTPNSGDMRFSSADQAILDWMAGYAGNLGVEMRHHAAYDYRFISSGSGRSHHLKQRLTSLGVPPALAPTKTIPDCVMRGGPEAWLAFLSGFLDTDGTVPLTAIEWASSSRFMLVQCQSLLARLGFQARLYYKDNGFAGTGRLTVCQARGAKRLAGMLAPVGPKADELMRLRNKDERESGPRNDPMQVASVVVEPSAEPTLAIEVDNGHTHLTDGIVTHNTQILLKLLLENRDKRILFLSLDDSTEMILLKLICMYEQINAEDLERRIRNDDEAARLLVRQGAQQVFSNLVVVDDSLTMSDIDLCLSEATAMWGAPPDLVAIDYLESILGGDDVRTKALALKAWCKDKTFPTVVIHQGTRSNAKPGTPLSMLSMAYGGEQEATFFIGVRRKRDNEEMDEWERKRHAHTITVQVLKNKIPPSKKTGPEGVDFYLDPNTGLIRNLHDDDLVYEPETPVETAKQATYTYRSVQDAATERVRADLA